MSESKYSGSLHWPKQEALLPAGTADRAAEDTVDEWVDGTVQGWEVLNDHRGVEAFLGVWKKTKIVQYVEEEVWTPTADEGWGKESHEHCSWPQLGGSFQWWPQVELQIGSLASAISQKYSELLHVNIHVMFTHTQAHIHMDVYTSHR